jgi:predicted AlkP superfamily pyrophosphatase or phosphodiesterase
MIVKTIRASLLLGICVAFLGLPALPQESAVPAKDRMVIVISLDGFPAYDLEDPKLPVPTLRQLAAGGSTAKRMQPVNPTVTWPNHTSMITGLHPAEHGLLYNGTLVRTAHPVSVKVDWTIPKEKMVHCATLYDIANEAGLTTAQVDWVAINDAPTITWAFPEKAKSSDPLIQEMIAKGALRTGDIGNEGHPTIVWRDEIWTKAGAYLIREHKPNLLLFHLLTLDSTHHNYGPRTLASYDAIAFLDSRVKELVDAVKAAGMLDRTTFVIVSDHGFRTVEKHISLNPLVAQAKLSENVKAVPEGGSAMIYVAHEQRSELLSKLRGIFTQTEGVAGVADESEYAALGLPLPEKDPQAPDLVVYAKPGYAFTGGKQSDPIIGPVPHPIGAHGYINTDPEMQAIFIASGYGIKQGITLDSIQNLSVAPILARLLGVKLPKTNGPALTQILK